VHMKIWRSYPYPGTLITANEGNETKRPKRNAKSGAKRNNYFVLHVATTPCHRSNVGGPMVHTRGGPYTPKATRDA